MQPTNIRETLNVLIVEDHPFIASLYIKAFDIVSNKNKFLKFKITTAVDCESACLKIKKAKKTAPFHLVLLDICIPSCEDNKLLSGEDLGLKIKQTFKDISLIVLTSHDDNHKLYCIFETLNPDGFLVKTDFTQHDLTRAITDVVNGDAYYSKTITKLIRSRMCNQIAIDKKDRAILYHLSEGLKMKDLPKVINLSLAAIERRKRHLRDIFDTKKQDDKALIARAKAKGFI